MQRWTEDLEEGGRPSLVAWMRMGRRRRATGEFLNLFFILKMFSKNILTCLLFSPPNAGMGGALALLLARMRQRRMTTVGEFLIYYFITRLFSKKL